MTQASETAPPAPQRAAPPEHDEGAVQVLASKLLVDWLRNRQQLLVPFSLDLQKLEAPSADVVIHAMAAAAIADGTSATEARKRIDPALAQMNPTESYRRRALEALERPQPLSDVLARIPDIKEGAVVYAACLLAIDRRQAVNRYFLRYLSARLGLPEQLARSVEQRYRST